MTDRDIVEVLREGAVAYPHDGSGPAHGARYSRAADEIEHLRAALFDIIKKCNGGYGTTRIRCIASEALGQLKQ